MIIKKMHHIKNIEEFLENHKEEKIIIKDSLANDFERTKKMIKLCNNKKLGVEIGKEFFFISRQLSSYCISDRTFEEVLIQEAENPL